MSEQTPPAFDPRKSPHKGSGTGPAWGAEWVRESLHRIRSASTVEEAVAQAAVEQVVLLHSIRRTLIWTAIIIPLVLFGLGVVLVTAEPGSPDCGTYRTRC